MALGLLIAAAVAGLLAVDVWCSANRTNDDSGLVASVLGWYVSRGMFVALLMLTALLLVGAGIAWVVSLF